MSFSMASSGASGPSLTWLWVLIGVVVLIGVLVLVLVGRRVGRYIGPDSVVVGGWLSGAIGAQEKGSALHREISAVQREDAEAMAAEDSGARWSAVQRRADDLGRMLQALREVAPESEDRARVTDALESLQSLRSAMGQPESSGGAGPGRPETVRARLEAFEVSLRRLRSPEEHLW